MYKEIIKTSVDELSRKIYNFYISVEYRSYLQIVFDIYQEQTRKSKRHKWVTSNNYSRIDRRNSNIAKQDIVIPEDIIVELKAMVKKEVDETTVRFELQ
jgi:hypothetical protein